MTRLVRPALVALVVGAGLVSTACDEHRRPPHAGDRDRVIETYRQRVVTSSRVGAPEAPLLRVTTRLRPNDWDVPPTLEWRLAFRDDRPTPVDAVRRAARLACVVPDGTHVLGPVVTATLVARGARAGVPTEVTIDCDEDYGPLLAWLDRLTHHPLPREVRGAQVDTDRDPSTAAQVFVSLLVAPADGTPRVAREVRRHACASRARSLLAVRLLTSTRPADVADPALHARLVDGVERGDCAGSGQVPQ